MFTMQQIEETSLHNIAVEKRKQESVVHGKRKGTFQHETVKPSEDLAPDNFTDSGLVHCSIFGSFQETIKLGM